MTPSAFKLLSSLVGLKLNRILREIPLCCLNMALYILLCIVMQSGKFKLWKRRDVRNLSALFFEVFPEKEISVKYPYIERDAIFSVSFVL